MSDVNMVEHGGSFRCQYAMGKDIRDESGSSEVILPKEIEYSLLLMFAFEKNAKQIATNKLGFDYFERLYITNKMNFELFLFDPSL